MNHPTTHPPVKPGRRVLLIQGLDEQLRNGILAITQPDRTGQPVTTEYTFRRVASDWGEAYLLEKQDGEKYHCLLDDAPSTNHICDCPDHLYRGRVCKHCLCLLALQKAGQLTISRNSEVVTLPTDEELEQEREELERERANVS